MTFDVLGPGALDYLPCRYGTSRLLFRGPRRDLNQPYIAFVGGTETYGKFISKPFPALVEERLGMNCVNFGLPNAGVDAFTFDPFVPCATEKSRITVIQVMGAQNMTNRFYAVHPRRNDRFVSAAGLLKTIFREVDFADFHYNRHMLMQLQRVSSDRFETIREELQAAWCARMRQLLKRITGKSVLLWFSDHAPPPSGDPSAHRDLSVDPLFITREMMADIGQFATHVVEVVATDAALAQGTEGMVFADLESVAAAEMLGLAAHEEAADALVEVISPMLA